MARRGHYEELRCVLAVIRHGDRTPKQKMKMKVTQAGAPPAAQKSLSPTIVYEPVGAKLCEAASHASLSRACL